MYHFYRVKKKRLKLSSDAVSIDLRHGSEFSTSDITVVSLKLTKASNEHDNTCIAAVTDCEIMHNEQLNSLQSPNQNGDQEKTMQVPFEGSNSFVLAGEINSKPELEMEQFLGNVSLSQNSRYVNVQGVSQSRKIIYKLTTNSLLTENCC